MPDGPTTTPEPASTGMTPKTKGRIGIAIFLVVQGIIVYAAKGGSSAISPPASTNAKCGTSYDVTYKVTGQAVTASVTFATATGIKQIDLVIVDKWAYEVTRD